jgi:hypothetical protein
MSPYAFAMDLNLRLGVNLLVCQQSNARRSLLMRVEGTESSKSEASLRVRQKRICVQ